MVNYQFNFLEQLFCICNSNLCGIGIPTEMSGLGKLISRVCLARFMFILYQGNQWRRPDIQNFAGQDLLLNLVLQFLCNILMFRIYKMKFLQGHNNFLKKNSCRRDNIIPMKISRFHSLRWVKFGKKLNKVNRGAHKLC